MARQDLEKAFEGRLRSLGYAVLRMENAGDADRGTGVVITDVRFKLGADGGVGVLAVIKGVREGALLISFVGGNDLTSTVLAVGKRLEKGALRWREDRPWAK